MDRQPPGESATAVNVTSALSGRIPGGGRIINLSSQAARAGGGAYGAAKAAIESWTAGLAPEVGRQGIMVNVIAPGLADDTDFYRRPISSEVRARLLAADANGREAMPDDVAALVVFVASADAGHITGQVLSVNGGA